MRPRILAASFLIVLLAGLDASRPPERQVSAAVAVAGLGVYQATLARVYANLGVTCRFHPTCSHYAVACLRHHGVVQGGWLAMRRVIRCGPWTPAGTVDPPPVPSSASGD